MSLFQWVLWRFYQNSYPYAGKTHDFGQERHEQKSEKKGFAATNVRIPYAKRIVFKKRAQKTTQGKMTLTMQVLHGCTFFPCQTHIRARDTKIRKKWKRKQKVKKSSKSDIAPFGPQSGTKQSIWRGYKTGLDEVMWVWSQKLIKKDAFDHQKMMRNLVWF